MVSKMGVLEYILNTPSHHRVHHGRNPRYLDRNYGGVLIIFDRMFGTFQEEDEEVYYGLVHPSQSFSLWSGQFAHFQYMAGRVWEERGFWNKWAVIWKGPGWRAGAPRMGFASDIPEIDPHQGKYDPKLPTGHYWYLGLNFVSIVCFAIFVNMGFLQTRSHTVLTPKTQIIMDNMKSLEEATSFEEEIYLQPDGGVLLLPSYFWHAVLIGLFTLSLQSFALISDNWRWAPHFEAARCAFFLAVDIFCHISAAPGEHRIFWYTDPAKRFTPWSPGFVLLRLNLLISFLYMAHHILVRDTHFTMPKRPSKRRTGLEGLKQDGEKRADSPIPPASSSSSSSSRRKRQTASSVSFPSEQEGGEVEIVRPVPTKRNTLGDKGSWYEQQKHLEESALERSDFSSAGPLSKEEESITPPTSTSPALSSSRLSPFEILASATNGKQSSSPSASPQLNSAKSRSKQRPFPVGVAL